MSDILKYIFILKDYYSQPSEMMPQKVLITTSVQKLKEELDKRFKIYETNMSLILATFLDVNNRLRYYPRENQLYSLENITKEL